MKRIKSIIAVVLVGLMVFTNFPGALYSNNVSAQINPEELSVCTSHDHHENNEGCHEGSSDCHEKCNETCNETSCGDHEECHEVSCGCDEHEALCSSESLSGKGVKIAVFDSGISDVDTAGNISFVEDEEVLSIHGNTSAHILKHMVPDSELYDVRILSNKNTGTYSNFAKGVDWAVKNDIDIISLGMVGYEPSEILENALKKAEENNILVVAAAGNGASDERTYPAAYPTVISVGALSEDSKIAEYSNYGDIVDVFAHASSEGTSFAAQYIAASAARKMESNPNISVKEIREQITGGKVKKAIEANSTSDGILYAAATCSHVFNGSYTTTKQPTCTTAGTKEGRCTKCGAVVSTVSIAALGHSYGSWTTVKAATCTTAGSRKSTCSRCSNVKTESISATGHTFNGSYTITKQPTCTAAGTKVGKCTKCGEVVSTVSIAALGHSYGSWTTTKAATCTTDGTRKRTCTRTGCSAYETETIKASGHTFNGSYTTTKEPTCTATGTKEGRCTKCGGVVSTASIPALGHSYGSWTTTKAATCTTDGTRKRTCTRTGCSAYETETIKASGHTFNGSYTTTKEPTCTATGTKEGRCTKCGGVVSTASIPALGHSYGSWTTTQAATCTTNGTRKRTCTRTGCSAYETETITASGHTFNGSFETSKEPTCTATGTKVGRCTKCGGIVTSSEIPALGHSYGSWTTTKAATCTTSGTRKRTCTRTGCSAYETETITATGHTFNGSFETIEPTCTKAGAKVGKCTKCGEVLTSSEIPPLDHSYDSGTIIKKETCTTDGLRKRTCTRTGCSAYTTETIKAIGHAFNGSFETIEPTCTEPGAKVGKCTRCGDVLTSSEIPPLDHSYDSGTTIKKETCTTDGVRKRTCTRTGCSAYKTETIKATGHAFNGSFDIIDPTCIKPGAKVGKCTRCGEILSSSEIPPLGHLYGTWTIIQKETCTTDGAKKGICTRNGCSHIEIKTIKATGHAFNGSFEIKYPTCTTPGSRVAKCTRCGKVLSSETIPAAHTLDIITTTPKIDLINGLNTLGSTLKVYVTCSKCGEKIEDVTSKAAFSTSNSSVATVTGGRIKSGTKQGSATITASYNGKKAVCSVNVSVAGQNNLRALSVIPGSETLTEFNKRGSKLKVMAVYDNGAYDVTSEVQFSSGNSSIAYVSDGYIKSGLWVQGSTVITASYNGLKATCNVTVDTSAEVETKPLRIGKSTGFTIPENLPVIGGTELDFDMDFIPASISMGKGEFKIAVGVDAEESVGEKWSDFKKTFEDAKGSINTMKKLKSAMKAFGSKTGKFSVTKGWEPGMEVYGYIEGTVNNGVHTITKGGIVIMVEANYTSQTQAFIGPVPVYLEIGGGIKLESVCEIIRYNHISGALKLNSELKITPRFEVGGGIGIAKVVTVGGTGEAELEFLIRDLEDYLKITLTGSLNLKATALFFEVKHAIAKGTWILYESKPTRTGQSALPADTFDMYNQDKYSIMSRDYIKNPSEWVGDKVKLPTRGGSYTNKEIRTLATNIYPNAQPQLINYGDRQVMVWISDNADRTSTNRTMLVYSVYDKATDVWSAPKAVDDDGTADFYPQLAQDGDNLYVVWHNSNKTFGDEATIDEVAASGEIAVSQFDKDANTFGAAVKLTDNNLVDTNPQIAAAYGKVYVTWTSNSENDIFGIEGNNSIYYAELEDGQWTSPALLCENLNAVPNLSAGFIEGSFTVAYALDEDNKLDTHDDREIYIVRPDSASIKLTDNNTLDSAPGFARLGGTEALYWYNGGNALYITKLDATPDKVFVEPEQGFNDSFEVLSDDTGKTAIIWPSTVNGATEIYSVIYDESSKVWSETVKISDIGSRIESPNGVLDDKGNYNIVFSKLTQSEDGNEQSQLCIMKVTPSYNLTIDSITLDHKNVIPGTQLPVEVSVTNNGEIGISELVIDILDGEEVINSTVSQVSIKPGETAAISASLNLPETITKKTYKVKVYTLEGKEYDTNDNIKEFVIGYTDISLTLGRYSEGNIENVTAYIQNVSHVPAGAVLTVRKGSENGEVIDTKTISSISNGDITEYKFQFDKSILCADKDSETLYFTVEADGEELFTSDNSSCIVLNVSDETKPVITVSQKSRDWSNSIVSVTPSIAAPEDSKPISVSYSWSKDETYNWMDYSSGEITQNEDGRWFLYIKAVDNAGNETIERFGPYNIDNTAPIITCNFNDKYKVGDTVKMEYLVEDTLSGVKISTITFNDKTYSNGENIKLDTVGKSIIKIRAVDAAGNVSEIVKEINVSVRYGDVNADGNITSTDYAYIQRYILGMIGKDGFKKFNGEAYPEGYIAADVNGTGITDPNALETVTSTDLAYVKRYILGMINEFPVEKM
jgi:predicted dienelactone hydrolase